jgi:Lar family restriction alleviation protein
MDKLKPCPFCGGKATVWKDLTQDWYQVYCEKCEANTQLKMKRFLAIRYWNRRVEVSND